MKKNGEPVDILPGKVSLRETVKETTVASNISMPKNFIAGPQARTRVKCTPAALTREGDGGERKLRIVQRIMITAADDCGGKTVRWMDGNG